MAARAIKEAEKVNEAVEVDAEKVDKDTEEVEKDEPNLQEEKPSAKEVTDEMCPDFQYGSETATEISKPNMKPPEDLPPPVRNRTLGGVDYYLLSYNDPIYGDQDY